jgi:tetratricopeptide (TPR) repeat protein
MVGRIDESVREAGRAQELDPVSVGITGTVGVMFHALRDYDRAIKEYTKAIELEPTSYLPYWYLVYAYGMKEMYEKSIAAAQKMLDLLGEKSSSQKTVLGQAYAMAGHQAEARKILEEIIALSEKIYVAPHDIALIYALLDENDKAIEWLQKFYKERGQCVSLLLLTPRLDSLRTDPRFTELLKKMGLKSIQSLWTNFN